MKIYSVTLPFLLLLISISSFTCKQKEPFSSKTIFLDTIQQDTILPNSIPIESEPVDTLKVDCYKQAVHVSYYHDKFNGKRTASGALYNSSKLTAAHKKLPFGTLLKVTNIRNDKWVIVEINDRGPFVKGRELDLSKSAFKTISDDSKGFIMANLEIVYE